jgi:hypothetical protein
MTTSTNSLPASTLPISTTAGLSSATSPNRKAPSAPASPSSNSSPLRRTVYLLATTQGFIADHSKKQVDDSTSFYTHHYEEALSYFSQDAATLRAQSIIDIEPSIEVKAVELYCDPRHYPYGWMEK